MKILYIERCSQCRYYVDLSSTCTNYTHFLCLKLSCKKFLDTDEIPKECPLKDVTLDLM